MTDLTAANSTQHLESVRNEALKAIELSTYEVNYSSKRERVLVGFDCFNKPVAFGYRRQHDGSVTCVIDDPADCIAKDVDWGFLVDVICSLFQISERDVPHAGDCVWSYYPPQSPVWNEIANAQRISELFASCA